MSKAAELAALIGSGQAQGDRNLIINGAMQVAQRGTQTGVRNSYGVDRFLTAGSGAQLFTYSQSTTVPSGQGFSYSAKLDVTTADSSPAAGDYQLLIQRFEGQDLQHLKYGTSSAESLTLQFWVRSPKTGTHIVELTHVDAGYQNSQAYTITSADTWQKVTLTFVGYQTTAITNDNTAGFTINWWLMAGSTYSGGTLASNTWQNTAANRAVGQVNVVDSTDNEFYLTGVQLEVGEQDTPFEHKDFGTTLAKCQRYFQNNGGNRVIVSSDVTSGSNYFLTVKYITAMRAAPSLAFSSNAANGFNTANPGTQQLATESFEVYKTATSTTGGGYYLFNYTADAELQMNITSAQYYNDISDSQAGIKANIDGTEMSIPLDPANRHYAEILRQVAAGELTIADAD